jgi:hypothetical protein
LPWGRRGSWSSPPPITWTTWRTPPSDWIEQRKRELEAEAEICRKLDEKSDEFRQQVIRSVVEKGYFEVDDEFLINREKANQRALEDWAKKDFGGLRFATEEEEAEMEAEWYPPYQPDEDDAAVLALLSEDEDDDPIDEAQGVDEAHVHKVVAATEAN